MNAPNPGSQNKMGTMPINRLLLSMSIPMVISMLVQALYNVVDSIFVAKLSEDALNAVSLTFPIQNLIIAVAVGTGVGINALLSKSLGEQQQAQANATAMNGLFLALMGSLLFIVVGLTCSHFFFSVQTSNTAILDYGTTYMTIVCLFSPSIFLQITFERTLQATGRTIYSMIVQAVGAIVNIILDPILIFGLFGFPRMEVAGAALATVTAQTTAAGLAVLLNLTRNHDIQFQFRGFRPNRSIISRIYSVGIPSIIMSSIGSVMVFGVNKILISFTTTATAVFGIYFKLQSFIFMPVFGLTNGMVSIIAFNYGARNPQRITKAIKLSILYAVGIMLVGLLLFQMIPEFLLGLFASDGSTEDMFAIGVPALRIISLSFLFAGYSIICASVFQALGHGVLSLIVSVIRQLFILLPMVFILSQLEGLSAAWWAFPIAELVGLVFSSLFLRQAYRREVYPLSP